MVLAQAVGLALAVGLEDLTGGVVVLGEGLHDGDEAVVAQGLQLAQVLALCLVGGLVDELVDELVVPPSHRKESSYWHEIKSGLKHFASDLVGIYLLCSI